MKVSLTPIGNSKGVRIPKKILEEVHAEKDFDLSVEEDRIILQVQRKPLRKGWEDQFNVLDFTDDETSLFPEDLDTGDFEWEW